MFTRTRYAWYRNKFAFLWRHDYSKNRQRKWNVCICPQQDLSFSFDITRNILFTKSSLVSILKYIYLCFAFVHICTAFNKGAPAPMLVLFHCFEMFDLKLSTFLRLNSYHRGYQMYPAWVLTSTCSARVTHRLIMCSWKWTVPGILSKAQTVYCLIMSIQFRVGLMIKDR